MSASRKEPEREQTLPPTTSRIRLQLHANSIIEKVSKSIDNLKTRYYIQHAKLDSQLGSSLCIQDVIGANTPFCSIIFCKLKIHLAAGLYGR
jgi:hypothetical protein